MTFIAKHRGVRSKYSLAKAMKPVALVETKGVHLANQDSDYKALLLAQLTQAFCDARFKEAGDVSLEDDGVTSLTCGLVFDQSWRADMDR